MQKSGARSCLIEVWRRDSDSTGEPNPPYVFFKAIWVSMSAKYAREESFVAKERNARTVYTARADYYDAIDIDEDMVVRFEGREFGINGVLPDFQTRSRVDLDLRGQIHGA